MKKIRKIIIMSVCILIILFIIRLYIDHKLVKITSYDVTSSKIPSTFDGYKILQLSDLHNEDFGSQLTSKIISENPDVIFLTGDMVSANDVNYSNFLNLAKFLADKYEVYYIKGNHEGDLLNKNYIVLEDALKLYNIKILDNEKVELKNGKDIINLYGMWCNQRYYSRADADKSYIVEEKTITKLLGEADKSFYNILLFHTPAYFESYVNWGADLVITGHIHGGLVRLPFVGGVFSPDRKLFPKYCYGRYDKEMATMFVSSGLSRGETGFRLFNRPEIVCITLKSK